SFALTRRASSPAPACRSTAAWACESGGLSESRTTRKAEISKGIEHEREKACRRVWRLRLHWASGLRVSAGIQHSLHRRRPRRRQSEGCCRKNSRHRNGGI